MSFKNTKRRWIVYDCRGNIFFLLYQKQNSIFGAEAQSLDCNRKIRFSSVCFQGRIHVCSESAPAPAPPFWQVNHANSAYFRLFLGYFGVISATWPPPPFGSQPPLFTYPGSAPAFLPKKFTSQYCPVFITYVSKWFVMNRWHLGTEVCFWFLLLRKVCSV